MEYFLGSLFSFIIFVFISRSADKNSKKLKTILANRQSVRFDSIKHLIPILKFLQPKDKKETQATKAMKDNSISVIFVDNDAYWIKDNRLYTAKIINGKIDSNTTKTVDTMTMNKVELDKTIFIVDKLKEGFKNDSGNSGNKNL